MRMTGYPAKVKSISWSAKGKWLASSGAPAAIVWPFQGKDGPMGKAPLELGTRANIMTTSVKFHPVEDILAIGFIDGMILAVRIGDAEEALLRRPGKGAITSMSWSKSGKLLAFAPEPAIAAWLTFPLDEKDIAMSPAATGDRRTCLCRSRQRLGRDPP